MMLPILLSGAHLQASALTVRLLCSLAPTGPPGHFEIRIENLSPHPVDIVVEAELVLERADRTRRYDPLSPSPSFRAAVELSSTVARPATGLTRLRIPRQAFRTWRVSALDLGWHQKVSATRGGAMGFRSAVPPGSYDLDVSVHRDGVGWWVSPSLSVTVTQRGELLVHAAGDP